MKSLNGKELAEFIKERQLKQVRGLVQADKVQPKLAIIRTNPDPIVDSYMKLKQSYGEDIGVEVDVHTIDQSAAKDTITKLNNDPSVHGIIVQIPLPNPKETADILNTVSPNKDVDGLATETDFDPATPVAINWLLAGYNIDLRDKNIAVVGYGRLVGRPLVKMWKQSGIEATVADSKTKQSELRDLLLTANVIVCATGVPGLITADMVLPDAIIVDAGVATDSNGLIGDVDASVRHLPDIKITPEKGGVGPLTVCALFDNVLRAARNSLGLSK